VLLDKKYFAMQNIFYPAAHHTTRSVKTFFFYVSLTKKIFLMLDVKEKLNLLTQIYFFFNIKHQKYFFCQ
jgi:hypothetical protein